MAQTQNLPAAIGLDIGSTTVRCVVGVQEEEAPAPSIIGVGTAPSTGVKRGGVVDLETTVSAITAAVDEAERISGVATGEATVGVNGTHITSAASRGIIAIGNNNRAIAGEDLARAEEAATVMQLPPNREIIHIFPRRYTVDGQEYVKDPVGMHGMRLEVDTCLITAATPFLKNTTQSVTRAGLNVREHTAHPLAAARTTASNQDKEVGCAVVDIGAHTTGVAVFDDGELLHMAILPVGSAHISNDIAIGLRTEIETADKIKLEHVDADPGNPHKNEAFSVPELNGELLQVNTADVNSIARARLEELCQLINSELQKAKRDGMLPGGAIFSGGGANLHGLTEFAKQYLRLPAHLKMPQGFSGIVDTIENPEFATAVGLMLEDMRAEDAGSSKKELQTLISGLRDAVGGVMDRFRG
ncbi:cell division protein FtsA [Candidatus Saccharibacteria bacterium QS_5_54_17]|nr:MAG: cell division protein FtsA [Candidatus Saccharibacteria bacterium QS_5_54_17]